MKKVYRVVNTEGKFYVKKRLLGLWMNVLEKDALGKFITVCRDTREGALNVVFEMMEQYEKKPKDITVDEYTVTRKHAYYVSKEGKKVYVNTAYRFNARKEGYV